MRVISACQLLMSDRGLITCCIRWAVYLTHSAQTIVPTITGPMLSWAIIEAGVYLIAACLPMMRPILLAIIPRCLARRWNILTGTSAAYHPGKDSSHRVSGQVLGGRQKQFSRLPSDVLVNAPQSGEKGVQSEAGATRGPAIPLQELSTRNGIHRKVEVTVIHSPVT